MAEEKPKQISVQEFKMWLEGVEEMQEAGWTPDARQWERIRKRIGMIAGASLRDNNVVQPALPPGSHLAFPPHNTTAPSGAGGTTRAAPSSLTPGPQGPTPPRTATTASGVPLSLASGANPAQPVKTPDVDTSSGKYDSQFA